MTQKAPGLYFVRHLWVFILVKLQFPPQTSTSRNRFFLSGCNLTLIFCFCLPEPALAWSPAEVHTPIRHLAPDHNWRCKCAGVLHTLILSCLQSNAPASSLPFLLQSHGSSSASRSSADLLHLAPKHPILVSAHLSLLCFYYQADQYEFPVLMLLRSFWTFCVTTSAHLVWT